VSEERGRKKGAHILSPSHERREAAESGGCWEGCGGRMGWGGGGAEAI